MFRLLTDNHRVSCLHAWRKQSVGFIGKIPAYPEKYKKLSVRVFCMEDNDAITVSLVCQFAFSA